VCVLLLLLLLIDSLVLSVDSNREIGNGGNRTQLREDKKIDTKEQAID